MSSWWEKCLVLAGLRFGALRLAIAAPACDVRNCKAENCRPR